MKNLAGSLALILLNAGIITAQDNALTPNSMEETTLEAHLKSTDNKVATDGDIIFKDRRTKEDAGGQDFNAAFINFDNAVATDGDIIFKDRRDPPTSTIM